MQDLSGEEFQIGLTMSGAVSAGAYTAGVFDFLIQALDEWEKAREGKIPGVDPAAIPNHRVGIKVVSGASAGAITAAIGAITLADGGQKPGVHSKDGQDFPYYLPKLYETWVVRPTLVAEQAGQTDFLSLSDVESAPNPADDYSRTSGIAEPDAAQIQAVASLLNARLLDEIAAASLVVEEIRPPRAYISETLHIYMTLSNLRGIPYAIPFDGGAYHMISHGDRVHYAVSGLGAWRTSSAFADADPSRPLAAASLAEKNADKAKWKDYAICALASAAFPVGLAPRAIGATIGGTQPDEYCRKFPIDALADEPAVAPAWLPALLEEHPFWFTTADGGIIDNDPFEYARFSLKEGKLADPIPFELKKVDRAVIMVSPFPTLKPIAREGKPGMDIVGIVAALLPSLIDQARFKPSELILAAKESHGSRYLISPSRVVDGKAERYGIASGLLGGFGGFLARGFRDHDFQLGRRNCQRFLEATFALPAENKIIGRWQPGVVRKKFEALLSEEDEDRAKATETTYSVIPLLGSAAETVALPKWPRISQADFKTLMDRIAQRFDCIAPAALKQNVGGLLGFLLQLALVPPFGHLPGLIRAKSLEFIRLSILADLVRRDQIEGWSLPAGLPLDGDDVRLILAELVTPANDLCTIPDFVAATRSVTKTALDKKLIEATLEQLKTASGRPFEVWEAPWKDNAGHRLYALASRKPSMFEQIDNRLRAMFSKPKAAPTGT